MQIDDKTILGICTQLATLTERVNNVSKMFYFIVGGIGLQIIATVWAKINKKNGNGNGGGRTLRDEDYKLLETLGDISKKLDIEKDGKIIAYYGKRENKDD